MKMNRTTLLGLGLLLLLSGCRKSSLLEQLTPQEPVDYAQQVLSQVAAREFDTVEAALDPQLRTPSLHTTLETVAAAFPAEAAKSVTTVGSHTFAANGARTYSLTFEHEYSSIWLVTSVVLRKTGKGPYTVLGLHVRPQSRSLEEINRFTFEGKSALHFFFLVLTIAVPLFIVFALVVSFRTPIARRKWLWRLFVAVGVMQWSLNWTDGSVAVKPGTVTLLGAGFGRASSYAPVFLKVGVPLGALVFLARRRSLAAPDSGPVSSSGDLSQHPPEESDLSNVAGSQEPAVPSPLPEDADTAGPER